MLFVLGVNVAAIIVFIGYLSLISRTLFFPLHYFSVLTVVQLEQTFREKCPICEEKVKTKPCYCGA